MRINDGLLSRCKHGYIINQKAAKIFIDNYHLDLPVDYLFNQVIINNKQIKSGWTDPFLTQNTVQGKWPSLLR
jgi:GR25 family glycosyltransferase involved in LPS biosynthesis